MSAEPSLAATEGAAPESSKSVELSLKQEAEREGVVPQRPAAPAFHRPLVLDSPLLLMGPVSATAGSRGGAGGQRGALPSESTLCKRCLALYMCRSWSSHRPPRAWCPTPCRCSAAAPGHPPTLAPLPPPPPPPQQQQRLSVALQRPLEPAQLMSSSPSMALCTPIGLTHATS